MGMSVGGRKSGFTDEPNVVPMIDVLLVLLIIFMMQIPLNRKVMDVQLPQEQEEVEQQQVVQDQIVLDLGEDGSYSINADTLPFGALDARLHAVFDNRPVKIMFIKVAGNRPYRHVISAMDVARGAGVQVIGLTPPRQDQAGAGGGD